MGKAADRSDTSGYVGTSGAARRAGVSAEWIRQLAVKGRLASTVTPIGRLFRVEDVDELARERERARG